MSKFVRRCFFMAVAVMILNVDQAVEAQSIRFFVRQSSGLFEVKATPSTGGRFVVAPTGEWIAIPGLGSLPVRGYTDRASKGETVVARGQGSGRAHFSVIHTNNAGRVFQVFSEVGNLPITTGPISSVTGPTWDSPTGVISQNGKEVRRQLPLGARPK